MPLKNSDNERARGLVTLDARGATGAQDSSIWLYGSNYLLDGDFASYGQTYLWTIGLSFDTEQGNLADAGNVAFGGSGLHFYPYGTYAFDTSTGAAGRNGGNVDLWGGGLLGANSAQTLHVDAAGGAGGHAGDVALGAISTAWFRGNGTFGEDPTFNAAAIAVVVRGFQGDHGVERDGVAVEFHRGLEPRQLEVDGVSVQCHLHDPEALDASGAARDPGPDQ